MIVSREVIWKGLNFRKICMEDYVGLNGLEQCGNLYILEDKQEVSTRAMAIEKEWKGQISKASRR